MINDLERTHQNSLIVIARTWNKLIEPPREQEEPTDWRTNLTNHEIKNQHLCDEADAHRKGE